MTRAHLAALAALTSTALVQAQSARQLWNFTTYIDIENSILRSNGHILFTTLTNPQLYTLDPAASTPTAEVVDALPGVTALTGIAEVAPDVFAVIGGVRGSYNYTSETIFTVDFTGTSANATVVKTVATLPDAVMLNGMATLPSNPNVLVIADSRLGCLWRVDITTGAVAKSFSSTLMNATAGAAQPIGIDGLKISDDGAYAYFSNVNREYLGRLPIYDNGTVLVATGDIEVVTEFPGTDDWDDFQLNGTVAYGAQDPSYLSKVDLETGELEVVANITEISGGPTSVLLAGDGVAYITTRGDQASGTSGQVFEVTLP